MLPLRTFLTVLFQYCSERTINCCYARHYTGQIFQEPQRDIDIIIAKNNIPSIVAMIEAWPNLKIVGIIEHPHNTQLYIYGIKQGDQLFFCLDLHHTFSFKGQDYLKASSVLLKAVPAINGIGQQADPIDMALIYLFTHILKHRNLSESAITAINLAYQADRLAFEELLEVYFGDDASRMVTAVSEDKDTKRNITRLCKRFQSRQRQQDQLAYLFNAVTYYLTTSLERLFKRQDIRLVILGTDGAGKTTLINALKPLLAFLRPHIVHAQVKPVLPWQSQPDFNRANSHPHAKPQRSWLTSNIKLLYFFSLYWLDAVWPYRGSRIIIYDRYYIDILVDPRRYRFAGSPGLAAFLVRHLPSIHGYIGMSTPPIIAYKRKPEIDLLIMQKQYEAYQQLTQIHHNAIAIDGTHINDETLQSCVVFIATVSEQKAKTV